MKVLRFLTVLIVGFLFCGQAFAQDEAPKYRFGFSAVGAFPVDDIAGTNRAGLGMAVQINRQVGKHWTAGMSYYGTKIWGKKDFGNFEIDAYELTTRYYFYEIGNKYNIYVLLNSGWSFVDEEPDLKQDDLATAFGGGIEYLVWKNVSLEGGFMARKSGDKVDSVNPFISLSVPILQ